MIKAKLLTATGSDTDLYIGERVYEGAGTFSFTVPLGVRRIHACCIGAGGAYSGLNGDGGGGGGLAWANDIEVEPGETLQVTVGASGFDGGDSSIKRDSTLIMEATGGKKSQGGNDRVGGSYNLGDGISGGGGNGGNGGPSRFFGSDNAMQLLGAGGGAGGYMGNGGSGNQGAADEGSGAGSAGDRKRQSSGISIGGFPGGSGGGVGLNGRGATGAQLPDLENTGARNGNPGSGGNGAKFGGGNSDDSGGGGVRIIWGIRFSYPDNADIEAV